MILTLYTNDKNSSVASGFFWEWSILNALIYDLLSK